MLGKGNEFVFPDMSLLACQRGGLLASPALAGLQRCAYRGIQR